MAYVDRFIFRFNSVSGKAVRIVIADNDYTGAAVERRLGGSPQLRCELSGNIHGMSLEIPAECKVDDEFAFLYTSDPTRFAVRLEVDNVVVWRGFVTPELYAAPWVDPPYDVQITATDGLGELKMKEWPAIGSRTLKEILDTVLGATGLALGIRMISAAANDIAAAADLLTGTTVNLDHMAGKSYYDVLDGLLGSLHCTISQRNGVWLLVRETDVTSLTSGGQVSDTSGNTYPVKSFGSSQTHDCWPVGRLTTEIVPAKSVVEVECPNKLAALITDPDMELNLWQTNGSWTGEDGGYYTLDLGEYISQTASVANATRDADPGFRIKVSSRNTTPFDVGIMRLTVMTTGRDPRSGSDKTLYLKEVTTQGRTQMEWVAEESHFNDGLGMPKTLDHQDCKEFVTDIFRLPTGFNPIKTITIRVSSGRNTVCVHSVNIECMSVYDKAVTRLLMDNGARGDESYSPLFADSFAGNKGNFLLSNSPKGVTGALVGTWSSEAIPSVPYGEWLSKDMALSVATPRLRMSGRLFTVTSLPALFYSNKGLSYITEEWSLDLIEDEADISLISLPAAALQTVEVSVIVEDNNGRKGTVSGGEIVSPKTGDSSSGSGYLDWFIAESYEEDGETKYRLKLNPKYEGMYAEGWVSAGGVSEQGGGGGGTGYLRDLLDVNASMSPTQGQALVWDDALGKWTAGDVSVDLTPFERIANRVTTVSSSSNHTQYPTAKAVYDIVNTMLSSAMRFQGVTSTALVDGSTTNPVVVDGASYTATRGDVVVRSDVGLEYLWTGARWQQLGDETSYAKKTVTITGSGYLTGGGNLEAARTIDIADAVKTKIDNGATAFGYFTDGAANEAIKLKTQRTIWGQPFDGSGDVDGILSLSYATTSRATGIEITSSNEGEASIGFSSTHRTVFGRYPNRGFVWGSEAGELMTFLDNGNVGIGTTSPAYKHDVNGDSRTSGKVYIGTNGGFLEVVNVGTTASPVYALKSSLPFFSDSWVSAGGVSSTGSGGGITGYLKDLLDVNGSMIPVDGQALVWDSSLGDNGRWTSKNVSVDLTPFERTTNKVTSISASSTDGQYPSARAVYNAMGGYLPLTGGALQSSSNPILTLNTTGTSETGIKILRDSVEKGWLGYHDLVGVYLYNSTRARYLNYKDDGSLLFENNKVWHEGNDGSGSGLDADLLDGLQPSQLDVNTAKTLKGYDNRGVNNPPSWYMSNPGQITIFTEIAQTGGAISFPNYESRTTFTPWGDASGGRPTQLSLSDSGAFFRTSASDSAWNNWREFAFKDDLEQITFPISPRNFPNGTLVRTSIDYSTTSGAAFYMEIAGDVYGNGTVFTQVNGYIWDDSLLNYGVYNLGICRIPEMYAMNIDGNLCFWWPRIGYWHSFRVGVYASSAGDYSTNLVTSIDDAAHPSGTKEVTLSSNSYDSAFGDISSCAKLASPNNLVHSGNEFTFIPPNFSNGLWFNYRTSDYSSSGAVTEYLFGDGAGHALASITQGQFSGNAATATKLSTSRTIWGQSFDGTNNVDGILSLSYASTYRATGIEVTSSNNDEASIGFASTNRTVFGRYASRGFVWGSVAGEIMSLLDNGNVGIGTTSPAYKHDVNGDSRTSGKVYIGTNGGFLEVVNVGTTASPVYALKSSLPFFSDSWISAGGLSDTGEGGGATYLKNLLDVDDNLVESAGYGLVYDGTQWTSEQIVPASRKINGVTLTSDVSLSLGSLSNVSVTGATNGQQLIYNGNEWIAGTPAGAKFFHGTCSTSSSSNTKVVDCPSFTSADLVAGTAIAIVMQNRCDTTSTVTVNVNGTGANTLLAGFANRKAWSAQELILAVYDGSGEWDMLPTWYYTYYYGGGGSGGGGGTGSTVVVTPRLSSGTRIATITVDGSATDLYAPSVSVSQTQGSTGGTQIASVNSTAIYAPAVTVTQVQTSGVEVARIKVGSANPVSIFAPSGSGGASGVQTVVGKTGDVTTDQIATALTNAGYKLTDTVQDLSGYLPLTAGSSKALTNTLYTRGLLPTANASYDLGSLSAAYNNTYTKRVYLADGVYIEYDSTNRCVYVHGAGIATDSFVSAGGVSTTSN